jgi:hypothetical protein
MDQTKFEEVLASFKDMSKQQQLKVFQEIKSVADIVMPLRGYDDKENLDEMMKECKEEPLTEFEWNIIQYNVERNSRHFSLRTYIDEILVESRGKTWKKIWYGDDEKWK